MSVKAEKVVEAEVLWSRTTSERGLCAARQLRDARSPLLSGPISSSWAQVAWREAALHGSHWAGV